ncbi:MAG: PLDc_N domain-containing protein [Chlorobium sp.]|nr:PLDc_N domain-containing protein [Chlorobium sp.]
MFGLGGGEFLFVFIFLLLPALVIWTLIDILKSEFSGNNKIVWILVVMFLPFLGSLLYLGIGRNQKI